MDAAFSKSSMVMLTYTCRWRYAARPRNLEIPQLCSTVQSASPILHSCSAKPARVVNVPGASDSCLIKRKKMICFRGITLHWYTC